MAQVKRKTSVANPQKRKRSRNRKPMSAAARQEFAERMAKYRKKKTTSKRRTTAKSNPMAKVASKANGTRKRRRTTSTKRRNPILSMRRRRRNGPTDGVFGSGKNLVTESLTALVSMVATRQIPQMALGANNTGLMGYGANAATAFAAYFAAKQFISQRAAHAALIGGGLYLVDRVLTEKVSPIGQFLSLTGLGDATAAHSLGTIDNGYFVYPTVVDSTGQPIIPNQIAQAGANAYAQLPAGHKAQAMAGLPSRFARARRY